MRRMLVLGEKIVPEITTESLAKEGLKTLNPTLVLSDLSLGWNILVSEEALKRAIKVMGVFPHKEVLGNKAHMHRRGVLSKEINNSVYFNETYYDYLKNPKPYLLWLSKNVDVVFAYIDPDSSSLSHAIMVALGNLGKDVFNAYRK